MNEAYLSKSHDVNDFDRVQKEIFCSSSELQTPEVNLTMDRIRLKLKIMLY